MIDKLMSFLDSMDIAELLPDIHAVLGRLDSMMRIVVMIGPAVLLALGLIYLLLPPKEATYKAGFRTYWGMGSVQAWRFTQLLAGIVFTLLGLILGIVMWVKSGSLAAMSELDMVTEVIVLLLWQVGAAVVAYVGVAVTAFVMFDRTGAPRRSNRKKATRV